MISRLLVLVCLVAAPLQAQAPAIDPDLLASYRQQVALAAQVTAATRAVLLSSTPYKAHEAAKQQEANTRARLGAAITAKTGRTMDWSTGKLSAVEEKEPAK